ncbi:MAG: hypothetical protein JWQ29_2124 [Phenylobacterium sp.]|nr:hypothetical protein [Phenylobacterium sp.]
MRRRALLALMVLAAAAPLCARADEKKKAGGVTYIQINTLTGTTNKGGGRRGVLTVECGLDVPDGNLRERANLSLPRLRAAYVQAVQTYAAGLTPGSPPSVDFIGQTLQRQTDVVLGRPGARLLLGAILVN